jgi:hypothetical protein
MRMQDRYTGDIGDYVTYGLLRTLAEGRRLGIAWYLFPDETHNTDGRYTEYLDAPAKWRRFDPELFDALSRIVRLGQRHVAAIEASGLLGGARFSGEPLACTAAGPAGRRAWRAAWFQRVLQDLAGGELVFADPDNGLCDDTRFHPERTSCWKRMPLHEAKALADGRSAILYHHNSRFKGGHRAEVLHWAGRLGEDTIALYWRPYSNRTFFIVRPTAALAARARTFADIWAPHVELLTLDTAERGACHRA